MSYEDFLKPYIEKGLLKEQKTDFNAVTQTIIRAQRDLKTARANLAIDTAIAYTVAYSAMLRAARAFMLLKGYRPDDGAQHKTAVEFMAHYLGEKYKAITGKFNVMRRKRNDFTYDVEVLISRDEAQNALETAADFVKTIKDKIIESNPQREFKF